MITSIMLFFVPEKYLGQYQKNSSIVIFIIRLFLFYALWRLTYHLIWGSPELYEMEQSFMLSFASVIVESSVWLLKLFRDDVIYIEIERIVRLSNSGGVTVSTPCVGVEMLYAFMALIVSYPGNWLKKMWFLPLGLLSIHILNILRITSLAMMSFYAPEQLDFNHKYVFVIIVYSFIFFTWIKWIKINEKKPSENIS